MQLLISVTNLHEAQEATRGGADILDLKNPAEGSLGAPHPSTISEVYDYYQGKIPVSAALGDFPDLPGTASLAACGAASCGADYIKIGLHGSNTPAKVTRILESVQRTLAGKNHGGKTGKPRLIAAAYADYKTAGTLDPLLLPALAQKAGAAGCMIDTYNKEGKNLFYHLSVNFLADFIAKCNELGLLSALAGSIKTDDIELLKELAPDIIGVRGAVCADNNRQAKLEARRVAQFREALS